MQLETIADNIWIYNGSVVSFYGFPYTTRSTIIKLNDNRLWVHSPEKLNPELQAELRALGKVAYLISPNKLHHLFLAEWISAYPNAKTYAAPGLSDKRRDISFDRQLGASAEPEWADSIAQTLFQGSPVMEEVVFFHRSSASLILTDLIENFNPEHFTGWQRPIAAITGILAPNGKTPIDWRSSFIFGKAKAKKALNEILAWEPKNIIMAHGECVIGGACDFLRRSFSWVE